jgi:hypothetical protein
VKEEEDKLFAPGSNRTSDAQPIDWVQPPLLVRDGSQRTHITNLAKVCIGAITK